MSLLESWLGPIEDFRLRTLGKHSHFLASNAARAESARALRATWEFTDLIAPGETPLAWFQTLDGSHATAPVTPEVARQLYRSGMTIYLRQVSWLDNLVEDVAETLRIPPSYIECGLFCNQPGAKTLMHFDAVDTIAVQITGSKQWRIAPNTHVRTPTANWKIRSPVPPELRGYAHEPLPVTMPANAATYDMDSGAVLYVPGGYWHETLSDEESVSLHIHLVHYPWADAVIGMLRSRLLRQQPWRATAYEAWDSSRGTSPVPNLLASLREIVAEMSVDDVVLAEEPPPDLDTKVVRRAGTSVGVDEQSPGEPVTVTFEIDDHGRSRGTAVEMHHIQALATLTLARSSEPLSAGDLALRTPGLSPQEALELVRLLRSIGFTRRR